MVYSKLLKALRGELVVSQAELAEMLGCAFASVNRWERGRHEPNYKMKRKILTLCKKNRINMEE